MGYRSHRRPLDQLSGGLTVRPYYRLLALALVIYLAACAPALQPTPAPTVTPLPPRATLPPTWTPTRTPTPLPPTATASVTPSPTATPTVNPETICDQLWVDTNLEDGHILGWKQRATFFVSMPPGTGLTLRFVAIHQLTKKRKEAEVPGETMSVVQMPIKLLPLPGHYNWTLSLHSETFGELCPYQGWFIAAGRESTRAEERRVR